MNIDIEKLKDLFENKKWKIESDCELSEGLYETQYAWIEYLNKHEIIVISKRDLIDDFEDLVNEGCSALKRDQVCIVDPSCSNEWDDYVFLLIPTEFAIKSLVLGALP